MANFTLSNTGTRPYTVSGLKADLNLGQLAAGDVLTVTSNDEAMATVAPDGTAQAGFIGSGFVSGGAKSGTVTLTARVVKANGNPDLVATAVIDVGGIGDGEVTSIRFDFGDEVPQ